MSESAVENTVVNKAVDAGWFVRKCQWIGRRGAPDRLFIKGGRWLFIEFKDQHKVPEIHQEREIARLKAAGAEVHVVDSVIQGLEILGL